MYQELKDVWAEMTGETGVFSVTDIEVRGETLKSYALAPNSLRDVWLMSAQFAERDYLIFEDERWTYAEAMAETAASPTGCTLMVLAMATVWRWPCAIILNGC